ncbi:hypothetical protein [Phaeacidiphilus oryzae]|uniref:hypothetical protein n=1 Tax=Phaeacidiphilus oryzae TaxID=348818 RepID=UPI00068B210F|nr:hypothetical protein [Phaeacidiphilus oryzae]
MPSAATPPPTARRPNGRLRSLLREAGWSGQDLATAVNRAAEGTGLVRRYDRTTVAHWLSGSRPADPVPRLVAEVLTGALGRQVTVADTALSARGAPAAPGTPLPSTVSPARHRIGPEHVRAAESVLESMLTAVVRTGGDGVREALTGYLSTTVLPWLRVPAAPRVHHALLTAASRLAELTGFSCFDGHLHEPARGYYRTALALGREAGDPQCRALALRALSVQAHHLGRPSRALEYAESAAGEIPRLPDREGGWVAGQFAVAAAGCGDRSTALGQLSRARLLLDRATAAAGRPLASHAAALGRQEAELLCALGDRTGAIRALAGSVRERPPAEQLALAVTRARLAELQLDHGHLERACDTWQRLLDEAAALASARLDAARHRMRSRLLPHRRHPAAAALLARTAP